jgi:hypothetical protein
MLPTGYFHHRALFRELLKIQAGKILIPSREPILRVSEVPFCQLIHVIDKVGFDPAQPEPIDYEAGFYFNMGHAVHNLWQAAGTYNLSDSLIGDWQCTRILKQATDSTKITETVTTCNRVVHFTTYNHAIKYQCPHRLDCRHQQVYKELTIKKRNLTGHTDFLWRDKRGRYHLVDFKTTGEFLFDNPKRAISYGYYPSPKYFIQIEIYAVLLEQQYDIKIDTVTIVYVSRNKAKHSERKYKRAMLPFSRHMTNSIRRRRSHDIKRYQRRYDLARNWLDASTKQRHQLTDKLFESRPCHRPLDYMNKMSPAFMSNAPCEFHKDGSCYNREMLHRLRKLERK